MSSIVAKFYPNDRGLSITTSDKTEETLQSIDSTLKRIEIILLDCQKSNQRSPLDFLRDVVETSLSERKASQEK